MVFEKLHLALVLFGRRPGIKCTQIAPLARGRIALARVETKFARFKFLNHLFEVIALRVRAALWAAAERSEAVWFLELRRVCRETARCDAPAVPSRLSARNVARERRADGCRAPLPRLFSRSRTACLRTFAVPRRGGGKFTPARRALERPIAMACRADLTPCTPSRI